MTMKTEMFQGRGAMILQEAGSMKWALSIINMAFLSIVWKKQVVLRGIQWILKCLTGEEI